MANYNVGKVNIEIDAIENNAVSKIEKVINTLNKMAKLDKGVTETFKSVNQLANGLVKIQKVKLDSLNEQFKKISEETRNLNNSLNDIKEPKFKETAQALNRLSNAFKKLNDLKTLDYRGIYKSFSQINRILDPFLNKLNASKESLVAMNGVLKQLNGNSINKLNKGLTQTKTTTNKIKNDSKEIGTNFNKVFNIGKIYFFLNYFKQLGRGLANIVNTAIDFEETLNKFQVSMASFQKEATTYATNLAYAFNLSRESLMNYMSTFNSMLKSMGGLSDTTAYSLSKTLTELAMDYSSLFNVSIDRAMQSFQSVLSGQIRSIRSVSGIEVSDNTIYQYYKDLGGEKSLRQLSQLEKRLLKIYAVEKQMDKLGAIGDLSKTIDSTSNMIKQLQETWKEAFVYMGNIALKVFNPIIKVTLSLSLVFKELMKIWSETLGAITQEYNSNNYMSLFGEEVENTIDSVKELNGLLSFDKFEVLKSSSTNATSDEADKISKAIKQLTTDLNNITSQARKTADSILEWLGIVRDEDENNQVIYKLKEGYTNLDKIKTIAITLISLGAGKLLVSLANKITLVNGSLTTTISLSKALNTLLLTGLIYSVINLVQNWEKMEWWVRALNIAIATLSTTLLILKNRMLIVDVIAKAKTAIELFFNVIISKGYMATLSFGLLATTGMTLVSFISNFSNMDDWAKLVGKLGALTSALLSAAMAMGVFKSTTSVGLATFGIIAGITAMIVAIGNAKSKINSLKVEQFAEGGFATKGQLFVANEKTPEMIGSYDGKTAIANNQMITKGIEEASYRGFMRAMSNSDNSNITLNFNGIEGNALARALFTPMMNEARRNGYNIKKA
nr:MAG TPA: minor tail protein [Caudoviricetes sp.]